MQKRMIEIWVGVLVLLGFLAFLFMALKVSGLSLYHNPFARHDYEIKADFGDIGGLKVRSPVRIAGVAIGTVNSITLDPQSFKAVIEMSIENNVSLPSDTSASITASGILGDNYVSLTPGFASTNLQDGGSITTTYDATSWQSLISTFMSNGKGNNKTNS